MVNRLYSISANWGTVEAANWVPLDQALSAAGCDWIRFSGMQWFVWTALPKAQIVQLARQHLLPYGQCIVTAIRPEAADGAAPEWIWNWLNDKMQQQIQQEFTGGT